MKHLFIAGLLITSLWGCVNTGSKGDDPDAGYKVELNESKKWIANPETTEGINKMLSLVDAYLGSGNTDGKTLHNNLENEFRDIFKKCTMTGEAHNQLHNYLLPLKARLKKLEANPDYKIVKDIQAYLNSYENYFE